MSDQTHLTNFSGDKKAWPVYLTIGNVRSKTRNSPSKMAILLVALLPVPPKFTSKKAKKRSAQRTANDEILNAVFSFIFESLEAIAKHGKEMCCSDGKVRQCFPVLAAWIADHAENETLHGLKRMSCAVCEVPVERLGWDTKEVHPARDYQKYAEIEERYVNTGGEHNVASLLAVGVKMGRNIFTGLLRVEIPLLFKPDILHNIYLGLFKHLMQWIEDFLKKHGRQELFDEVWKSLPPYPGFFVPKKAYREVTQWQGKEMRNLGRCILGVFASSLRSPTPAQQSPFVDAIRCVRALVDFSLMAQYRSHTEDTLGYMEQYLHDFHRYKEVFQEFRTSKKTRQEADVHDEQLRLNLERKLKEAGKIPAAKRRRLLDENRLERTGKREEIHRNQSHFNFIKLHLLVHYCSHVRKFGNIPMYSTDVGELAHKVQIKEGYRHSNKNDASRQILHYYSRVHAVSMRLLTLRALQARKPEGASGLDNADRCFLDEISQTRSAIQLTETEATRPRRLLRGRDKNINSFKQLSENLGIPVEQIFNELMRYGRRSLQNPDRLIANKERLDTMPVEQFNQLQIPVLGFQETDVYDIHRARTTGERSFRNGGSRNDWVWVALGAANEYGALRGKLPGRLRGLFKVRDTGTNGKVYRLAIVQLLQTAGGNRISGAHGLVKVFARQQTSTDEFWIVDITTVTGLAHLIPEGDGKWLVNSRIDLRTFNDVY